MDLSDTGATSPTRGVGTIKNDDGAHAVFGSGYERERRRRYHVTRTGGPAAE
jgi:hypothetical protein